MMPLREAWQDSNRSNSVVDVCAFRSDDGHGLFAHFLASYILPRGPHKTEAREAIPKPWNYGGMFRKYFRLRPIC